MSQQVYDGVHKDWRKLDARVVEDRSMKTRAITYIREGDLYIAFRGTDNAKNALLDLAAVYPVELANSDPIKGTLCGGFILAYQSLRESLLDDVKRRMNESSFKGVYLTGHSLGGAMATYCAIDLADMGLNIKKLVTFGQPACGAKNFKKNANRVLGRDTHIRFVHRFTSDLKIEVKDLVVDYPLQIKDAVWTHSGTKKAIRPLNKDGKEINEIVRSALDMHRIDGYKWTIDKTY